MINKNTCYIWQLFSSSGHLGALWECHVVPSPQSCHNRAIRGQESQWVDCHRKVRRCSQGEPCKWTTGGYRKVRRYSSDKTFTRGTKEEEEEAQIKVLAKVFFNTWKLTCEKLFYNCKTISYLQFVGTCKQPNMPYMKVIYTHRKVWGQYKLAHSCSMIWYKCKKFFGPLIVFQKQVISLL